MRAFKCCLGHLTSTLSFTTTIRYWYRHLGTAKKRTSVPGLIVFLFLFYTLFTAKVTNQFLISFLQKMRRIFSCKYWKSRKNQDLFCLISTKNMWVGQNLPPPCRVRVNDLSNSVDGLSLSCLVFGILREADKAPLPETEPFRVRKE